MAARAQLGAIRRDLESVPLHQRFPAVVPRAVLAELPAGSPYAKLTRLGEQEQTVAKEQIIIRHRCTSSWA